MKALDFAFKYFESQPFPKIWNYALNSDEGFFNVFFLIFVVLLDVGESGWEHSSAHSAYATFQPKWNKVK